MERPALVALRKAHMANNIGREHQPPSRPPIRLLVFLLLLGTLFAWWGTRDYPRLFGGSLLEPVPTYGMVLQQVPQEESTVLGLVPQTSPPHVTISHKLP